MLKFSSNLNIVQEPSISKFVTHHIMLLSLVSSLKNRFFWQEVREEWCMAPQGPVVRKPINLIQDERKLLFHFLKLFGESFFCLFLFFKINFFYNVKFCQISALNSILE